MSPLTVVRDAVPVCDALRSLATAPAAAPMHVRFEGEDGIDAGGPAKERCRLLTAACLGDGGRHSEGLFETADPGDPTLHVVMPASGAPEDALAAFGALVARCIVRDVAVHEAHFLPPVVWRVLAAPSDDAAAAAAAAPCRDECAAFLGRAHAARIERVALLSDAELEAWDLDFGGLKPGGASERVTAGNAHEYVRLKLLREYCGPARQSALLAMRRGVVEADTFGVRDKRIVAEAMAAHGIGPAEMLLLVGGSSELLLGPEIDAGRVQFRGFPRHHRFREVMSRVLRSLPSGEARMFAVFASASDRVPSAGVSFQYQARGMSRNSYFVAHTCSRSVDVSPLDEQHLTEAALRQRLLESMRMAAAGGFQVA